MNIIYGVIILGTYLSLQRVYRDYFFISGLALTIWYHWETLKQLNGQKNKLDSINRLIGVLLIPFSVILILHSLYIFTLATDLNGDAMMILMGILRSGFGLLVLFVSVKTLRLYKKAS